MSMYYEPRLLHPDGKLVTPLEVFRGATRLAGTINSGAQTSGPYLSGYGMTLSSVPSSAAVRTRLVGLEMYNAEPQWLEVEFRDGAWHGARVAGPYRLEPYSEKRLDYWQLLGAYFTSSIFGIARSGGAAQPLSNGILVNARFVNEPDFYYE